MDGANHLSTKLEELSFNESIVFQDITDLIKQDTKSLKEGELLHSVDFSLYEVMSAIEIMNPSMDPGARENSVSRKSGIVQSTQQLREWIKSLTFEEVLTLMDQMFMNLINWLKGSSLHQTLYSLTIIRRFNELDLTSLIVLKNEIINEPDNIDVKSSILVIYALLCKKCCQSIWKEMSKSQIYEEEDFTTNISNLSFYSEISIKETLYMAHNFFEILNSTIKNDQLENKTSLLKAISKRIFITQFILNIFDRLDSINSEIFRELVEDIKIMDGYLELKKTYLKATAPNKDGKFDDVCELNIINVTNFNIPLKPIKHIKYEEAIDYICQIVKELLQLTSIPEFINTFHLFGFLSYFSKIISTPLSKSWAQTLIYRNRRALLKYKLDKLAYDMLIIFKQNLNPEILEFLGDYKINFEQDFYTINLDENRDSDSEFKIRIKHLLNRLSMHILTYVRALCKNQCRQRRLLIKFINMIERSDISTELSQFSKEFYKDEFNQATNCCSNIVLFLKLLSMKKILELGFVSKLYKDQELISIYMYYTYLIDTMILLCII